VEKRSEWTGIGNLNRKEKNLSRKREERNGKGCDLSWKRAYLT
jgi:hypothetical protein